MSDGTNFNKKRKIDEVSVDSEDDKFLKTFMEGSIVSKDTYEDILTNLILDLEDKTNTYLNLSNIIVDFKKSILENREGMINRCLECGVDMGRSNPRQLCGKTYCYSQ